MGGDPMPGSHEVLREWFELPGKKGKERAEAMARIEEFLKKVEIRNRERRF